MKQAIKKVEAIDGKRLSEQSLPEGIKEIADISYIADGKKAHLLDVYYPENVTGKLPVIIDVHGGGLVYGWKEINKNYCYHLAKRGFVVFNINYRLALNDAKVPGQLQDIAAVINWIAENIGDFPADIEKAFITGDSAGGYLAALVALIRQSGRMQKIFDIEQPRVAFKAIGIISGMMNLAHEKFIYRILRSVCLERGYKKQEYYQNLIFEKIPEMKDFPPCYLATSEEDPLKYMTFSFETLLKNLGAEYKLKYFNKEEGQTLGHVFSIAYPELPQSIEVIDDMLNFFKSKI